MSKTLGATAAPPVDGVPVMLTLMPPVEGNRQFPRLSFAAESWYCHRAFVAGFQHAPRLVLQGVGAAQPAVAQLACAGVAARMTGTNDSSIRTEVPIARRFMRSSSCERETCGNERSVERGTEEVNSVGRNAPVAGRIERCQPSARIAAWSARIRAPELQGIRPSLSRFSASAGLIHCGWR